MDSADISQPYPAVQLDLHLRQIRLVTILPGRYVDAITCQLRTASVDNLPEYYSLSYAWGDRTDPRQIFLNGVSFNVTRNLEASLRRLRHPTKSQLFWIDMLCINQECVEERTHQVNLMELIYSRAREVFLWLGDYAETTTQKSSPSSHLKEDQDVSNFSPQYHHSNITFSKWIIPHKLTRLKSVSQPNRSCSCPELHRAAVYRSTY